MTPESLATLLGVVLAILAFLPPERRLDVQVRLSRLDWLVLWVGVLAVHYILFFPVLDELGWAIPLGSWRWGFTEATTSYLIILGTSTFILVRLSIAKIGRNRIESLRRLVEALLQQRKFDDVLYLLERNLASVERIAESRFLLSTLKEKVIPSPWGMLCHEKELKLKWYQAEWLQRLASRLPSYEESVSAAKDTFRLVLTNDRFVTELAASRPYLGLEILARRLSWVSDFQELWLSSLLDDKYSVLYAEIANNQNTSGIRRYAYPPSNRIIYFYFSDPKRAEKLALYKPIGDYVLSRLRKLQRHPLDDMYNEPLDDFFDSGRWKDPIHAVLRLFDFMVVEALHADVRWHMWLYYLPSFVDRILSNLSPIPSVDLTREWPTPYHYFLYEIVHLLGDWVAEVAEVPSGQENIRLESQALKHENGNIPKSAALALGVVFKSVLESDKLAGSFKAYLFEIALRIVSDLKKDTPYGQLLTSSLANGGYKHGSSAARYHAAVREVMENMDVVARVEHEDELFAAFK